MIEDTSDRRRAAFSVRRAWRLTVAILAPVRGIGRAFDRVDERRAGELRLEYGRRLRLVSWEREADGRWAGAALGARERPHDRADRPVAVRGR